MRIMDNIALNLTDVRIHSNQVAAILSVRSRKPALYCSNFAEIYEVNCLIYKYI